MANPEDLYFTKTLEISYRETTSRGLVVQAETDSGQRIILVAGVDKSVSSADAVKAGDLILRGLDILLAKRTKH